MFDAYITIEHCEIRECLRRYIANKDPLSPILEDAERQMSQDRRMGLDAALNNALSAFMEKNSGMLEKRDAEIIVHTCQEIGGMKRGFISEILGKTGQLLEKRIQECRERDVKNGKLMNQLGIIIGIAIIILIV